MFFIQIQFLQREEYLITWEFCAIKVCSFKVCDEVQNSETQFGHKPLFTARMSNVVVLIFVCRYQFHFYLFTLINILRSNNETQ